MIKLNTPVTVGNLGAKIRSDCQLTLEIKDSGGIQFSVKSKVNALFGESIKKLCLDGLAFFGIEHAVLKLEDKGALPFVLMARLEAAVKQLIETEKEFQQLYLHLQLCYAHIMILYLHWFFVHPNRQ